MLLLTPGVLLRLAHLSPRILPSIPRSYSALVGARRGRRYIGSTGPVSVSAPFLTSDSPAPRTPSSTPSPSPSQTSARPSLSAREEQNGDPEPDPEPEP